jgi:glyoxylase-like metal-dependent hydrolase (beta-lactamase superfamily II)
MRTTTYGDNFAQLTRFPVLFPMNCYLVRENDGYTLIDTAIAGSEKGILASAQSLNAPIVCIVLTHAHGDHAGSLDALHVTLPDAEVIVAERSVPLLAGDLSLLPGEPVDKLRGMWVKCTTKPDRTVVAGDRIGSLEVIATPGHTPDSISFLDTRDNTLIAGDAYQTRDGIAVSGVVRPLFPFPALATWHKTTALESARALYALKPSKLAVGHGIVLTDPLPAMERAIAVAEGVFAKQEGQYATQSK